MNGDFSYTITEAPGDERMARTGVISTPHGDIATPAFIPVGTQAAMKSMTVDMMSDIGAQALLANAYHLHLRPGQGLVEKAGGLGKFMNWSGPTYTDSGGFQILSLGSGFKKVISMDTQTAENAKKSSRHAFVDDDGVNFKSHLDGSMRRLTAEVSMQIQHALGADICFAFDELTSLADPDEYHREALDRTHAWAVRSMNEWERLRQAHPERPYQALFGVLQGANIEQLRRETAQYLPTLGFDGYGIGGAIEKAILEDTVRWVNEELPANQPKHLLGISEPDDIFAGIASGADTFDCVSPTRVARNGAAYTRDGRYNVSAAKWKEDFSPIDPECECKVCAQYSRAYIRHLFNANETLAGTLVSYHNEHFIIKMVDLIRQSIANGTFDSVRKEWVARYYAK